VRSSRFSDDIDMNNAPQPVCDRYFGRASCRGTANVALEKKGIQ
jgi:hypothetical protein